MAYSSTVGLLLLLLPCLLSSTSAASNDPVIDTAGNPVVRGARYYMTASDDGNGMGMTSPNGSCPLSVIKMTFSYGPPVMLFPDQYQSYVPTFELLYIMFAEPTECTSSTLWTVDPETDLVTTGGAQAPDPETPNDSRFRLIHGGRNRYELISCAANDKLGCIPIGVKEGQLKRGAYPPLHIMFTKVPEGEAVSSNVHATA